ncbi:MAG: T9SS type A sorting domain-containing protein [Bacteroidetes bacterium]|nr:T9SS type A sorting domain-containing protein [Bacteroidota bacterium]
MRKIYLLLLLVICANTFAANFWQPAGTMSQGNTDYVYALAGASNGAVFASSWAVGMYKGSSATNVWNLSGLSGKRISDVFTAPDGTIYCFSKTTSTSYIHRSTDNGGSWQDVYTRAFANNYAGGGGMVFPSDGSIVAAYAVTVGPTIGDVATYVFKSTDGGNNWVQKAVIGAGFVGGMKLLRDGRILMGTSLSGVVMSTNNGENWVNFTAFPLMFIHNIMQADDNTLYVCDAYGPNRSTDNGATFVDVSPPISGALIEASFVDSHGNLFISYNHSNIYYSTNRGDTWTLIANGLPGTSYICSLGEVNGKVYGGTNNSGVLYFTPDITGVISANHLEGTYKLNQNYPNPFNPTTGISFSISKSSFVNLSVYDVTGKIISELVNSHKAAGDYSINFDASSLPAGIYFYALRTEDFSETKKMILSK